MTILITMGDPVGIGPEIIARVFVRGAAADGVVVGDVGVMRRAMALLKEPWPIAQLDSPLDASQCPQRCMPVWQPEGLPHSLHQLAWGVVDPGKAAAVCIEAAVHAVQRGEGSALVTAPIHKAALAAAGVPYPGHTEMLQALAGGVPVRMMLANDELRVVLVTIHQSLRSAIDAVTFDAVLGTLRIAHGSAKGQRIAVADCRPST